MGRSTVGGDPTVGRDTARVSARTGAAAFDASNPLQEGHVLATGRARTSPPRKRNSSTAIDIAQSQSSKLFELQSCIGLARLWLRQGKPMEARSLLEPIHAWFTEGLTLPDLRAAREVLAL